MAIACQQAHIVYATGTDPLIISEWQYGERVEESDIGRYGDPFHQKTDIKRCRPWLTALGIHSADPLVAAQ